MFKTILTSIVLIVLSASLVQAAYLTNIATKITQPNGVELKCFVSGDEFYHRLHDEDNYTIIKQSQFRGFL